MEPKLSIETLMPATNGTSYARGRLDVNSISSKGALSTDPKKEFDSRRLLNNIYERRKKLRNWIVEIYNSCCKKIEDADEDNRTDIIFEVPVTQGNYANKTREALNYISENLKKDFIDSYIINDRKIFITWKYIELNKETRMAQLAPDSN